MEAGDATYLTINASTGQLDVVVPWSAKTKRSTPETVTVRKTCTESTLFDEYTFVINYVDPCVASTFNGITLSPMYRSPFIGSVPQTVTISDTVTDSEATVDCGPYTYTLVAVDGSTDLTSILTIIGNVITFNVLSDHAHYQDGETYATRITISFNDALYTNTADEDFNAVVSKCLVTSTTPDSAFEAVD